MWLEIALGNYQTIPPGLLLREKIVGASTTLSAVAEHAFGDKVVDVAKSRVLRTPAYFRPLGGGQFPFKAIPQTIDDFALSLIYVNFPVNALRRIYQIITAFMR